VLASAAAGDGEANVSKKKRRAEADSDMNPAAGGATAAVFDPVRAAQEGVAYENRLLGRLSLSAALALVLGAAYNLAYDRVVNPKVAAALRSEAPDDAGVQAAASALEWPHLFAGYHVPSRVFSDLPDLEAKGEDAVLATLRSGDASLRLILQKRAPVTLAYLQIRVALQDGTPLTDAQIAYFRQHPAYFMRALTLDRPSGATAQEAKVLESALAASEAAVRNLWLFCGYLAAVSAIMGLYWALARRTPARAASGRRS